MAEPTEDVPFSVEYARKEDCVEFQEHLNFREAYLKMHIETINKFLPGRIKVLNDRIAVWEKISANNYVERKRRFEKIKEAELVVHQLTDEKKSHCNDLKETKWYKKQFLDPRKLSGPVNVKAKKNMRPQAGRRRSSTYFAKRNLPWPGARGCFQRRV